MRDAIDGCLDDLAHYSAEILLQKYSHDEVKSVAGPWAFWPEGLSIEDMAIMLTVAVKGGSSGKPDTTSQQRSWAQTFPLLQQAAIQIGQLRQSAPSDIADGLQELVEETLHRSGDGLDATRFLPPPPSEKPMDAGPMPQMAPAQPAPGPQAPPIQGGSNLAPVPHNGMIGGHRPN
jgi:hypothetical protein